MGAGKWELAAVAKCLFGRGLVQIRAEEAYEGPTEEEAKIRKRVEVLLDFLQSIQDERNPRTRQELATLAGLLATTINPDIPAADQVPLL
jgi:hypothetical protein